MTVFPPLLWHGEHLSYFSTVCSGNFYKTNTKRMEGSASPGVHTKRKPPQWTQAGNRLQLSNPHNTQCRAAERNTNSNTPFPTVW